MFANFNEINVTLVANFAALPFPALSSLALSKLRKISTRKLIKENEISGSITVN